MRILMVADITGAGVEYHVGDEAMAEVAIERFKSRFGAENLVMACSSPDAIPATYGIRSFAYYSMTDADSRKLLFTRPWSFFKGFFTLLFHLLRSDAVFICGGGNITSVWRGVLESRLRLIKWATRLNRRVILASQTLGPYTDADRPKARQILSHTDWLGVRDKAFSAAQTGLPVKFAIDDAAFLEPSHDEFTRELAVSKTPFITLSLRRFGGIGNEELHRLSSQIVELTGKMGLHTIFIPHHAPGGTEGDIKLINEAAHLWSVKNSLTILDPIPMAAPLKALTAESQWVLTMRYHQLIFALSTGVPAIGVYVDEYTQAKLNGAFEQFELAPRLISIHEVEMLPELLEQVLSERSLFKQAAQRAATEGLEANLRPYQLI